MLVGERFLRNTRAFTKLADPLTKLSGEIDRRHALNVEF